MTIQTNEDTISIFRMVIKNHSPFFTVLVYNCRFIATEKAPTAATDGRRVYYNPEFIHNLSSNERIAVFLHEVLHIVYGHPYRRKLRDSFRWNLASDIYVNHIIDQLSWCALPEGAVREPDLWRETTEEIYALLKENPQVEEKYKPQEITLSDLWEMPSEEKGEAEAPGSKPGFGFIPATTQELQQNETKWKNLLEQAAQEQLEKSSKFGDLPGHLQRTLANLKVPQIDWREALMRYLISCPNDYNNYDRRFVADGFYTESLEGSSVRVDVCIDTSGSIGTKELSIFVSELVGIIQAYPQLCCDLYWADTKAYGPYDISAIADIPQAEGGGGTCFKDFFIKMQEVEEKEVAKIAVYLTDGYGSFPKETPADIDTLWVVTKDGLDLKQFPFGLAVKLTE